MQLLKRLVLKIVRKWVRVTIIQNHGFQPLLQSKWDLYHQDEVVAYENQIMG
uniref:Uncharacterized protein n=1 Tax=Solanum tuberosum TaxID=4113 RepID=M1D3K1_SOLTU